MTFDNSETLGKLVQFHRKRSGLNRVKLADLAGIGKTAVFDIEHGKETVKLKTILKILSALNIKLSADSPIINEFGAADA